MEVFQIAARTEVEAEIAVQMEDVDSIAARMEQITLIAVRTVAKEETVLSHHILSMKTDTNTRNQKCLLTFNSVNYVI